MSLKDYLRGKKILVTGAGRGIGRSLCVRLHEYEAKVIALSQTKENLLSLEKDCPGISTICVDVGDWSATRAEISKLGLIDGLINNAGIFQTEDFMTMIPETIDRILNVNFKAAVNISQVIARKMIDAGKGGSIVNVSSVAGKRALGNCPTYCASKAALDMITRNMAVALGPHKIRVNSLNPGAIETDMSIAAMKSLTPEYEKMFFDKLAIKKKFIPMDDIVNTTLFLLSDMATMMTGELVGVDGGLLLM